MRKLFLIILTTSMVWLAGCLPQAQATLNPTATTQAQPSPTVAVTAPTQAALVPDSGCTAITKKPTPGPTPQSIYPAVADKEWVKGPASAKVTIVEYADFQ